MNIQSAIHSCSLSDSHALCTNKSKIFTHQDAVSSQPKKVECFSVGEDAMQEMFGRWSWSVSIFCTRDSSCLHITGSLQNTESSRDYWASDCFTMFQACLRCNWSDGKLNWSKVIIINFIVIVYANFHSHYNFLIMITWQFSHKNVHLCSYMCSQCLMWYLWSSCSIQSWKYYGNGCACKRTAGVRG